MALMLGALHDALKSAGADPNSARKAAEEVAGYESELADVKSDLRLLKWMVGTNIALSVAGFSILGNVLCDCGAFAMTTLNDIAEKTAELLALVRAMRQDVQSFNKEMKASLDGRLRGGGLPGGPRWDRRHRGPRPDPAGGRNLGLRRRGRRDS